MHSFYALVGLFESEVKCYVIIEVDDTIAGIEPFRYDDTGIHAPESGVPGKPN